MNPTEVDSIKFKHSRFTTRLLTDRLYTPAHFWLKEHTPNVWHVGFTKFAQRMLGEIVEIDFEVGTGHPIKQGQIVGWAEAFKAVTDIYAISDGIFSGGNPEIIKDPGIIDADANHQGWLYAIEGQPDSTAMNAQGYADLLTETIDRLRGTMYDTEGPNT